MPNSGLPTPDDFAGDADFICIPIVVPNKPEFMAAIYGLYGQMSNEWFWKQQGTMTPETAAWLSSRGLGLTNAYGECTSMNCDDVADCVEQQLAIDTETNTPINQTFYDTISNFINNSGYGNPNRVNPTLTTIPTRQAAGFNDTEIKDLPNCDLNKLWASVRYIAERLAENANDMLQDLAALNDLPQRYQAFIDIVPVLGDVAEAVATAATEVIPDILNQFDSYASEAQLDELACEIFSMVCAECRYPTWKELFDYYAGQGHDIGDMDAVALANVTSSLVSMISGALPSSVVYHTTIAFQLLVLYLNAKWNGLQGTDSIARLATLGEDFANDNWLQLCETCNEQWQIEYFDFTQSPSGWFPLPKVGTSSQFGAKWVAGQGWRVNTNTDGVIYAAIGYDIEQQFRVRGAGFNYVGSVNEANSGISLWASKASTVGATNLSESTGANYNRSNCALGVTQNYVMITMGISPNDATLTQYIEKAFIVYDAGYGRGQRAASRAVC